MTNNIIKFELRTRRQQRFKIFEVKEHDINGFDIRRKELKMIETDTNYFKILKN